VPAEQLEEKIQVANLAKVEMARKVAMSASARSRPRCGEFVSATKHACQSGACRRKQVKIWSKLWLATALFTN